VIAHEAEVVVLGADLERAWHAVLGDDRFPDRETHVIGIRRERGLLLRCVRAHDVGVRLDRVEILVVRQEVGLAQQARVPVRRPALVHDLAGEHGIEIERLLAHGAEHVTLPLLELGRVLGDEPEQVALGLRRNRRAYAL
jgi:hypothetical protein